MVLIVLYPLRTIHLPNVFPLYQHVMGIPLKRSRGTLIHCTAEINISIVDLFRDKQG
jgi:hypothetical protein